MGSEQSSDNGNPDQVTIPRAMMEDFCNTNKKLEMEAIAHITKAIDDANVITKLRNENRELETLRQEYDEMNKEIKQYQSIPALKEILILHSDLKRFHEKLSAAMKVDVVSEESVEFENKLKELQLEIAHLDHEMKEKNVKITPKFFRDELNHALMEMNMLKRSRTRKQQQREEKLSEMLLQLKDSAKKMDDLIPEVMNDVRVQIAQFEKELSDIEDSRPEFTEKEKTACKKVLALQMNHRQQFVDFLTIHSHKSEYEEHNTENNEKLFHIVLQNVKEEYEDFINDKDKVLHILQLFSNITIEQFRVRRLGASSIGNTRPIMVTFTTHRYVSIFLKRKNEKHNTKYGDIKIRPFIKDIKGKESNYKKTKCS